MSSWSDGNAANTIGVFIKCGDKILGRNAGLGHNETLLKSALQRKHGALTDNAWSSLTSFAVVIAKRNAVLSDSHLMSDSKIGLNGGWHRELRTIIKSHVGLRTTRRRQWQLAAFKKVTINWSDPSEEAPNSDRWADKAIRQNQQGQWDV